MGRINAGPPGLVAGGRGMTAMTGRRPAGRRAAVATVSANPAVRVLRLAFLGGLIWFAASTISGLADAGPTFDTATYIAALVLSAVLGALLDRSGRDDLALAAGSAVGLAVSSLFLPLGAEAPAADSVILMSIVTGFLVLLSVNAARGPLGRWLPGR